MIDRGGAAGEQRAAAATDDPDGTEARSSDPPRSPVEPGPGRLPPDDPDRQAILDAHRAAVEAGAPTYTDPATGYGVFTAAYLAATGRCCGSGCRHCPWSEPTRS